MLRFFYEARPPTIYAQIFVLAMSIIFMLLAISTLIAPMVASFLLAFRWKKLALNELCDDIRHEQAMAESLANYEPVALKDARFWFERKVRCKSVQGVFSGRKLPQSVCWQPRINLLLNLVALNGFPVL